MNKLSSYKIFRAQTFDNGVGKFTWNELENWVKSSSFIPYTNFE